MAMGIELGQDPNKEEKVKRLWDRIENPTRQVAGLGGEVATGLATCLVGLVMLDMV